LITSHRPFLRPAAASTSGTQDGRRAEQMSERGQSPGVGESWGNARPTAGGPMGPSRSAFPSSSHSGSQQDVFHGQGKGFRFGQGKVTSNGKGKGPVPWQGKGRGFQRQSLPPKGKGKGTFKGKGSNPLDRRYGKEQEAQWGKGNVPASHSLDLPERLQGVLRYIRSTTRNRAPSTAAAASHACQDCWKCLTSPPQAKFACQGFQYRWDNKTVSSFHSEKQVASLFEDPRSDSSHPAQVSDQGGQHWWGIKVPPGRQGTTSPQDSVRQAPQSRKRGR
jgi:hypothetical protein